MGIRAYRRQLELQRKAVAQRFERHRRRNLIAKRGVHDFIIILDYLSPNFNIGKIFRSAEAFGACEVHLLGTDFFDPAPAKGAFKHVPAKFYMDFIDSYNNLVERGYTIFVLEPSSGQSLFSFDIPEKSAFVLGNEKDGISINYKDYENISTITIPQCGKVESLNVSNTASIVMYEYVRQHGRPEY